MLKKKSRRVFGLKRRSRTIRRFRRRVSSRRPRLALANRMYRFSRYVPDISGMNVLNGNFSHTTMVLSSSAAGGNTETDFACYFKLDDIGQYTELAGIFDHYKLSCVVVTIKMVNVPEAYDNPEAVTSNYQNFYPTLWYCPDHDDATTAAISDIKQRANVKHVVLRPNREIKIVIRPSIIQSAVSAAGGVTTYATRIRPWINCATAAAAHYGLKGCIDYEGLSTTTVASNTFQFKFNAKYYVKFRDPV